MKFSPILNNDIFGFFSGGVPEGIGSNVLNDYPQSESISSLVVPKARTYLPSCVCPESDLPLINPARTLPCLAERELVVESLVKLSTTGLQVELIVTTPLELVSVVLLPLRKSKILVPILTLFIFIYLQVSFVIIEVMPSLVEVVAPTIFKVLVPILIPLT
nr:MAG TPA: hypothetical protein [Bacteriophage sp.]DAJ12926.1 MAG TPA: hypothetical protein [Bacteriophage sp.]